MMHIWCVNKRNIYAFSDQQGFCGVYGDFRKGKRVCQKERGVDGAIITVQLLQSNLIFIHS